MKYREVEPEELLILENSAIVDVRSPSEYREFHIPRAVNIPVFDDNEKKLIGLIYRNEGAPMAFEKGREFALKKLPSILERFKDLTSNYESVIVYCWRGGMRSKGVCEALSRQGLKVMRLRGGYRAYRKFILKKMSDLLEQKDLIVITGKTGTGKTRIIKHLKKEGFPAVDLEGIAKHRGSLFGRVGIKEQITQKMFDSLLFEDLWKLDGSYLIVEDESRRIGNIHIPDSLWEKKENGYFVEVRVPLSERIRIIHEDYTSTEGWEDEVLSALMRLKKFLGNRKLILATELFKSGRVEELIEFIIKEHYDKRYRTFKKPNKVIECGSLEECLNETKLFLFEYEGKVQNCPAKG